MPTLSLSAHLIPAGGVSVIDLDTAAADNALRFGAADPSVRTHGHTQTDTQRRAQRERLLGNRENVF